MTQLATPLRVLTVVALAATLLGGCTSVNDWKSMRAKRAPVPWDQAVVVGQERPETIVGMALDGTLVTFNAGTPDKLISTTEMKGLVSNERVTTMDYDPGRNRLYALTSLGRIVTVDPDAGSMVSLDGILKIAGRGRWSMDVDAQGRYLRMAEQTGFGQQVNLEAATGKLVSTVTLQKPAFAPNDLLQGKVPRLVALAYTHAPGAAATRGYAIDGNSGYLVHDHWDTVQGQFDAEGVNHLLSAIGPTGLPEIAYAAMDIDRETGTAYLVASGDEPGPSKFYEINLATGQTKLIGTVAHPYRLSAITIRP
jgi:Domain of unknown function (DUF4394)